MTYVDTLFIFDATRRDSCELRIVGRISALGPEMQALGDEQVRAD
jgi:hypothetical protein